MPTSDHISWLVGKVTQLTLEQHRIELHWSTYMQIFFSKIHWTIVLRFVTIKKNMFFFLASLYCGNITYSMYNIQSMC